MMWIVFANAVGLLVVLGVAVVIRRGFVKREWKRQLARFGGAAGIVEMTNSAISTRLSRGETLGLLCCCTKGN
jgi:hypothetical protein